MDEEPGEKVSRKDRFRDALARTKTKLREHGKKDDKDDFKLSDDVNDFLQSGRPSTSDSGAGRSETPPDKLWYPQLDHEQMVQAGLTNPVLAQDRNITPPRLVNPAQRPSRGIAVPKIDVTRSQRWPAQQELGNLRGQEVDNFLRPAEPRDQHLRSQSQGAIPGRRKGPRPRNLSVAFLEAPPIIIGEGGDEAEAPPREIGRAKARARSVSPMPGRGSEGQLQQLRRKQLPTSASPTGVGSSPQSRFEPQRLGRVQTGLQYPTSASSKSSAEMAEFEMSLQAPTPIATGRGSSPAPSVNRHIPPAQPGRAVSPPLMDGPAEIEASQFAQTKYGERHLRPAIADQDLQMQFEEGQALRHSHYRGLSNTSIIERNVSPVSPDLRQLDLDDAAKQHGVISKTKLDSDISPISPEEPPGGWI